METELPKFVNCSQPNEYRLKADFCDVKEDGMFKRQSYFQSENLLEVSKKRNPVENMKYSEELLLSQILDEAGISK